MLVAEDREERRVIVCLERGEQRIDRFVGRRKGFLVRSRGSERQYKQEYQREPAYSVQHGNGMHGGDRFVECVSGIHLLSP